MKAAIRRPDRTLRARSLAAVLVPGALVALSGLVELPWLGTMSRHGAGLFEFELMRTSGRAVHVLSTWGAAGRRAARLSSWVDFGFIASYTCLFIALAKATEPRLRNRQARPLVSLPRFLILAAVAAAAANVVDKAALLSVLYGHAKSPAPLIAFVCSVATYIFLGIAIVVAAMSLAMASWPRRDPTTGQVTDGTVDRKVMASH